MFSNGLVKYKSQFDSILKSPSRFITMGEAYMRVISLPVGERSIADTVRTRLKFSINDVLNDKESRETIATFSKFGDENAKIVKNITGADQSQLVKAQRGQKYLNNSHQGSLKYCQMADLGYRVVST